MPDGPARFRFSDCTQRPRKVHNYFLIGTWCSDRRRVNHYTVEQIPGMRGNSHPPCRDNQTPPAAGATEGGRTEHRKGTTVDVTTGSTTPIYVPVKESSSGQDIQLEERWAHEDALASALQSVADAADVVRNSTVEEYDNTIIIRLGPFQDMTSALDAARQLGWQTTDERLDAEAMFSGKGTGFR